MNQSIEKLLVQNNKLLKLLTIVGIGFTVLFAIEILLQIYSLTI